jgi:hypothetical protein
MMTPTIATYGADTHFSKIANRTKSTRMEKIILAKNVLKDKED